MPFITGRLAAGPKTAIEALLGTDLFTGAKKQLWITPEVEGVARHLAIVAQDVAEWMVPIFAGGYLPGAAGSGQTGLGQVAVATVGVGSRKATAAGDVYEWASDWLRNHPDPAVRLQQKRRDAESPPPSDYRVLDNLLDAGKLDSARKAYESLLAAGHSERAVKARYARSYLPTGSTARERDFEASLTPAQKKTYERAKIEREDRREAFLKMLDLIPDGAVLEPAAVE